MNKQVETFLTGTPRNGQWSPQDVTVSRRVCAVGWFLITWRQFSPIMAVLPGLLAMLGPFIT